MSIRYFGDKGESFIHLKNKKSHHQEKAVFLRIKLIYLRCDIESQYFLVENSYALCTSCHSDSTLEGQVHHPNREMFEGLAVVEQVDGIPARHFAAENGPPG